MFKRLTSWTDGNASFLRAARAGNLEKVLEYLKGSIDINTSNANGLNALHLASKEGHINVVTELLKRGANVEAATKKGNTALHIASLAGQEEIVKILVQSHAKVNVQATNGGFTPLYMAAQENHKEVVKYLLANGASQTLSTDDGFTPLAVALQQGHDKVVAVLLENDTRGKVKLPALHIAAKKDDVKAATLLLHSDHKVDSQSKSGFTPLHIAAHYGNINVGSLLIEKGADINFKARNNITPLHVASKWGRTNMVTLLLDSGAVIGSKTRDGLTPLHCGARSGHDQVVDLLLEKGAPVSEKTKNGLGPLHMAAQGDHVDCARLLLYHKAPLDEVTVDYLTPLHVAAHCGNVRTAKLLLDKKCEVDSRALNGFTPLHIACKKNRIKVVELLLKYGASIDATTESGLTPLHVASFMGHMNIVIYLIQHGGKPDTPTVRGETALHLAARANQTDIIRILLRNGAQVDAKAREQQTPLHIAARLGNVDNVVLLLQHGASPDAVTKDLYTPLHIAAKEGHEEVTSVLLEHGASQGLTTKKGFTPLHIAAKYGHIKVAQMLLSKDANPNVQGKNGLTPLHVATHYNNVNVALLLLESDASPHATAKNGYTPLHIAAKKNQMDIATTLIEYGAKPDAESKNGFAPLHLAAQEGHTEMVSLLLEHNADVNCKAKNGLTPLHLSAQEDKVPVAEVLVKYEAQIDPQTKAGYTPLHTACHFGQINMIRFLLEQGASVNATTKLGYTPLHQAAQQGHVLVINLLLKYNASPNAVTTTGQTPLSIAQKLGYISVVETLKNITEVQAAPGASDEKYKVVSPETMQEATMSDSEDEGGDDLLPSSPIFGRPISEQHVYLPYYEGSTLQKSEDTLLGDQSYQYLSTDDMKILQDDSISPIREERDFQYFERYSVATAYSERFSTRSSVGDRSSLDRSGVSVDRSLPPPTIEEPVPEETKAVKQQAPYDESELTNGYPAEDATDYPAVFDTMERKEEKLQSSIAPPHQYASKAMSEHSRDTTLYGSSYSGVSFASSFDPDNVAVDRHPQYSGFLVSFMVDARGGAMRGCRHSGVRIIVPPGKACMPTRVTCKLVKKEKLMNPPPLMESEALASRILEMGPVGAKFLGPVIIEVPHFASLREQEREIVILRSDDGHTWREHQMEASEEAIQEALNGSFEGEDLESAEELYQKRITRILTTDFPHYFAVVTRVRQESKAIGVEGGMLSSSVVPHVQVVFPPNALTKKIKVGLQAHPVQPETVSKLLGNRVAVSPIVTVEPRRRRFHEPITVTIPVPKAAQKGMLNTYGGETPTLRLLCSITGGTAPAQWEDITGSSPLTFVNDCVSFTTTVSARFWLMDCQNFNEATKMATELYREVIAVPFMSKFVVFAKRHDNMEAKLRVFCMTDDKMDKTLESQEHFAEVARSRDVEVLEGKPQYVEMGGNIVPVTKSGDQLYINFHAFRENRLPLMVRIRDSNQEPIGRLAFMREPKVARGEVPQTPICNLNITLPPVTKSEAQLELDAEELKQKYDAMKGGGIAEEHIERAEVRLTDIADALQGDWVALARQLKISEEEIERISREYSTDNERALVMLHLWVQINADQATGPSGNELERALMKIGREDLIRRCMYNIEEVTDEVEKAVAKVQLDQSGFDEFKEELGPSRDSSMQRGLSLDVSYDEQDIIKESESAAEESDAESVKRVEVTVVDRAAVEDVLEERMRQAEEVQRPASLISEGDDELIVPRIDERHAVVKSPTAAEEDDEYRRKQQAFAALAETLDSNIEVEIVQAPDDEPEERRSVEEEPIEESVRPTAPAPAVEELITSMESAEVHGMDDRISLSSSSSDHSLDQKEVSEEQLVSKLSAQQQEAAIVPTSYVSDQAAPESEKAFQAPQVRREESAVHAASTVSEKEETTPDGHTIRTTVTVTKHTKTVTETVSSATETSTTEFEELVGTEVEEEILDLPPGVTDPYAENVETSTSIDESEETNPDGTWTRRTTKVSVANLLAPPEAAVKAVDAPGQDQMGAPSEIASAVGALPAEAVVFKRPEVKEIITGEVIYKEVDHSESEQMLDDGSTVRTTVTVIEHVKPVTTVLVCEGVEERKTEDQLVGTEINEDITQLPAGVTDPHAENTESSTEVQESEETHPDGTWTRRTTKKTIVRVIQLAPVEKVIEGEIEKKTEVSESEQKQDDDSTIRTTITITEHVKPVTVVTTIGKEETRTTKEELVGTEIEEDIIVLPSGVDEPYGDGLESSTDVTESEETNPDGTWTKRTTKKTMVTVVQLVPQLKEVVEGEVEKRVEISESEQEEENGSLIQIKVKVTEHVQPITEVYELRGVEEKKVEEKFLGVEIEEDITELPPNYDASIPQNVEKSESVQESEETKPDGTFERKITKTTIVQVIEPAAPEEVSISSPSAEEEQFEMAPTDIASPGAVAERAAPFPVVKGVIEGEVAKRVVVTENDETRDDGAKVKTITTVTQHVLPITEVIEVEGVEQRNEKEKFLGTEISEDIVVLPVDYDESVPQNIEKEESVQDADETNPDGTWVKKTIKTTTVKVVAPKEVSVVSPSAEPQQVEFEAQQTTALEAAPGIAAAPIVKAVIEGETTQHKEVSESEQTLDDGTVVRTVTTVTEHIKTFTDVVDVAGVEERKDREVLVGTEVEEDVTEVATEVDENVPQNIERSEAVQDSEETNPDGTWVKKTVRTTTVKVVAAPVPVESPSAVPEPLEVVAKEVAPVEVFSEAPAPIVKSTLVGDVFTKTEKGETEDKKDDGTVVKTVTTTTKHVKPITEVLIMDGVEQQNEREELVATEVDVDITEIPQYYDESIPQNLERARSVQEAKETHGDGTYTITKTTTTKITLLDEPKPFVKDRVEGEIEKKVETDEKEETKEDGTVVKTVTTTTRLMRPVREVIVFKGVEEVQDREELVGTEVDVDIMETPQYYDASIPQNIERARSVQEAKEGHGDGTYTTTKTTTTKITLLDEPKPFVKDRVEGEIMKKVETDEKEETKEDGTVVKTVTTTTRLMRPVQEVIVFKGVEEVQDREELVGTDVDVDITETPQYYDASIPQNIERARSVQEAKEGHGDGTYTITKTTTTKITLLDEPKPFVKDRVEGEITQKVETDEKEETKEDGTVVKTVTTTTSLVRPVHEVIVFKGVEETQDREELVGKEVEIDVAETPRGYDASIPQNLERARSVQEARETHGDGTYTTTTTTTTKITLLDEPKPIVKERIEGDVQKRSEVEETETTTEDCTHVHTKITTTKHIQPVSEVLIVDGVEQQSDREELLGTEIEEEITNTPANFNPNAPQNIERARSVQESKIGHGDGTWTMKKVITITIRVLDESPIDEDAISPSEEVPVHRAPPPTPVPFIKDVIEGEVTCETDVSESEQVLEDGTLVVTKITVTEHSRNVTEVLDDGQGNEERRDKEQAVGTEILEEITESPASYDASIPQNVERATSVQESKEGHEDGTWTSKKTVKTTITVLSAPEPKVQTIVGETETRSEVNEFEETDKDGNVIRTKETTTTYFQPIITITEKDGEESSAVSEKLVGTEIDTEITQMPPGYTGPETQSIETATSTEQSEETNSEGVWTKRKTTRITVHVLDAQQVAQYAGDTVAASAPEAAPQVEEPVAEDLISQDTITQAQTAPPPKPVQEEDISFEEQPQVESKPPAQPVTEEELTAEAAPAPAESVPPPVAEGEIDPETVDLIMRGTAPELQPSTDEVEEEIEEVLPDGTVVKRKLVQTKMKKIVTRKIRRVGPDGEVIEDVVSEEVPESELLSEHSSRASSLRSSFSDLHELTSPLPSLSPSVEMGSPSQSDSEAGGVRVYTDTIEGEPQVETDVQEFEETLPDGTVVKRKVIKTKQKQTIVKRVVMEGPETDLPSTEAQAQQMLQDGAIYEPGLTYTDQMEAAPETSQDVMETEETLPDGSLVKKRVVTTTEEQLKTERTVVEGASNLPQFSEDDLFPEAVAQDEPRHPVFEEVPAEVSPVDEPVIDPSMQDEVHRPPPTAPQYEEAVVDEEPVVVEREELAEAGIPAGITPVDEAEIEPVLKDYVPKEVEQINGAAAAAADRDTYQSPPYVDIPQQRIPYEEGEETEEGDESSSALVSQEDGAAGGEDDLQTTRLVLKKQVHKKTVIRDGREETIVTEDTHVEQDNDGPEELRESVQDIIDQFMDDKPLDSDKK